MNAVVTRLDVNELAAKVDLNAVLAQVDVEALVERTDLGAILTRTGAGVAGEAVDAARSAGVGLDGFVHRWVDRALRRPVDTPRGPPLLVAAAPATEPP